MSSDEISRDEALAIVWRLLRAAGRRDLPALMECYATDAVALSPLIGEMKGREAIGAMWATLFKTFADVDIDTSNMMVDRNRVVVFGRVTSVDRHGWFGRAPTGGAIDYRLALLLTIGGGQIVRDERLYDSAGVLERLEKARLDKELSTAADVQRTLLSKTAHVTGFCEAIGDSVPCRAIGGDFFEFAALPSGDVGLAMGDVSGKGPAAALLAAMLQGMLAVEAPMADSPAATMSRLNRRLADRRLDARFATLLYGVLSPDGRFVYSNAGHNPPALLARGGVRRLTTGGPILGAFEEARFEQETVQLQPRDTLVMFTDGVTEARNPADDEFGDDRLLACLTTNASTPPSDLLARVFDRVRQFCDHADQSDDITVTVTRYT